MSTIEVILYAIAAVYVWICWLSPQALTLRSLAWAARSHADALESETYRRSRLTELQRAQLTKTAESTIPWKSRTVTLTATVRDVDSGGTVSFGRYCLLHPALSFHASIMVPVEDAIGFKKGQRIRIKGTVVYATFYAFRIRDSPELGLSLADGRII